MNVKKEIEPVVGNGTSYGLMEELQKAHDDAIYTGENDCVSPCAVKQINEDGRNRIIVLLAELALKYMKSM